MSLHTAMNAPRRSGRICACTRCTHLTTCDRTTGADMHSTDADWCGEFEEA